MDSYDKNKSWVVCLSSFPPRKCGIATFTADLGGAIDRMFGPFVKTKIVAMNPKASSFPYSRDVIFQISQFVEQDYIDAALKLNRLNKVRLVNIQHEFGIFGGNYGSYLLLFMKKLKKPIIITLHTVIPGPDSKMRDVVKSVAEHSKKIVVMTQSARDILVADYGLNHEQIEVIPHGIHHVSFTTSERAKASLGFSGKLVISTFGLLNPGKGIEYAIDALPSVVEKYPDVCFLIAGVTHPAVLRREGEKYRNFLTKKVHELDLEDHVYFFNTYLNLSDLVEFLEATNIYLSTSLNPHQTVSGTLSYALGSGRPVISTAFEQAKVDITSDVGILVDFKDSQAFSRAIIKLLSNDELRLKMGKNAYFRTRHMTWENTSLAYIKCFSKFVPELASAQRKLPPVKLAHLARLTDDFGIIQFAELTEPDLSSGYTLDDNARALIVAVLHYKKFEVPASLRLAFTYLNFISRVIRPDGYFDNYVGQDRVIDKQRNLRESSEDPSARALYALAIVSVTKQIPKRLRSQAYCLFKESFRRDLEFSSPRAIAFYAKALCHLASGRKEAETVAVLKSCCDKLVALYENNHSRQWEWFEHYLTYSNALLPEALLLGHKTTGEQVYFETAEKTLNFLIEHTFKGGIYVPIGQRGWFFRDGKRQYFDQQPEDTAAIIEALNTMFGMTQKERYKKLAKDAFNWFLGENTLKQTVYDYTTGGCYDGIGEKFINLNQGAESTISYLAARLSFINNKI